MLCTLSLFRYLQECLTILLLVTVESLHFFSVASQTMTFQLSQVFVAFSEVPYNFTVTLDRSRCNLCPGIDVFLLTCSFHTFFCLTFAFAQCLHAFIVPYVSTQPSNCRMSSGQSVHFGEKTDLGYFHIDPLPNI